MTSNGSVKEFILITNDEYCFLKNQPQKEIKGLDCREKQKQQILAQVSASLEYPSSSEKKLKRAQTEQLIRSKHWLPKSIWIPGLGSKKVR